MYLKFLKRLLDIIVSIIAILVLSPSFIITLVCLYFANDGHPFFFQERPGKHGRIFKIIKFKTMNDRKDHAGILLPDSERLTPIGRFVRRTSLDEIPQLINVIKGDMSLIGPRPLRTYYLPLYSETQKRRHEVRPGITGWAQVNGRNTISWTKKFEYDVWYVDNVTFLLDCKIIWLTIIKVIKGKDINSSETVTMEPFNGRN
jgi:undecaprenyl phosphate N,N'-diacetylbacillosamine 1-phosphate transferase